MMGAMATIFGKYRALVSSNDDPLRLGRLQVTLPDFPAMKEAWAMPCIPYAGPNVGFYSIPPVGACVWVEFEGGNPDAPIWSGCFWLEGQVPALGAGASSGGEGGSGPKPDTKFWKTETISMVLDDTSDQKGGFSLKVEPPAVKNELTMVFDKEGITITCSPSVVKLQTEQITIDHPQGKITMKDGEISITLASASITMSESSIKSELAPASVTISQSGVKTAVGASTIEASATGVKTTAGAASTNVQAAMISLGVGAASIEMSPVTVAINKDALVVI